MVPFRALNTFDPFIVFEQEVNLWRFGERMPTPTASQSLVFSGSAGLSVIDAGQRVPRWRMGGYRHLYLVDVAEHPLELTCALPARDSAFVFNAHLAYTCWVSDPAEAVRKSVRDVAATVGPLLTHAMRRMTITFDAGDGGPAEERVNAVLAVPLSEAGLAVRRCVATLTIDSDEASGVRAHRKTAMELSTRELRFRKYEEFVRDGNAKLVALHLAEHPEDAGALLDMLAGRESEDSDRFIQTLRVLLSSGGGDEDFDIEEGRRRMLRGIFDRAAPDGSSASRRISASRVKGTLLSGGRDPAPTIESEAETAAPEPAAEPGTGRPPASRVRSSPRPAPRDPDAEAS